MSVQKKQQRIARLARQRESSADGLRIFWNLDVQRYHVGITVRSSAIMVAPNSGLNMMFLASPGNHRTDHGLRGSAAGLAHSARSSLFSASTMPNPLPQPLAKECAKAAKICEYAML